MPKNKTVLIVDDDKFLLEMYRNKFVFSGLEAEVAMGSEEALNKLREGSKPDILVLDIIMPGMDGLELLAAIRKEKLVPEASVIMLSNETDQDKIDTAKSLGIDGYIVKATSVPSEVVDHVLEITK